MPEGVVIVATLIWAGGLYLTITGRVLLGALTSVAAWAVWLLFSITTYRQLGILMAAVSLAISLAAFWFWKGRGGAGGGPAPKSEASRGWCVRAWCAECAACAAHGPSPGPNRDGHRPSGDDVSGPSAWLGPLRTLPGMVAGGQPHYA